MPHLHITEDRTSIDSQAVIQFLNPYNNQFVVVELSVDLHLQIQIELLQDFRLSGRVQNLTLAVNSLKTFFKTNTKTENLKFKIHALEDPLTKAINSLLASGLDLALDSRKIDEFGSSQLFVYDHYLMIEARPNVERLFRKEVQKWTGEVRRYIEERSE